MGHERHGARYPNRSVEHGDLGQIYLARQYGLEYIEFQQCCCMRLAQAHHVNRCANICFGFEVAQVDGWQSTVAHLFLSMGPCNTCRTVNNGSK